MRKRFFQIEERECSKAGAERVWSFGNEQSQYDESPDRERIKDHEKRNTHGLGEVTNREGSEEGDA